MAESAVDLVLLWAVGEPLSCVLFLMFALLDTTRNKILKLET